MQRDTERLWLFHALGATPLEEYEANEVIEVAVGLGVEHEVVIRTLLHTVLRAEDRRGLDGSPTGRRPLLTAAIATERSMNETRVKVYRRFLRAA